MTSPDQVNNEADEPCDHDWQEKHDDSGEVDGIPGDHWSWRECRKCGQIEDL